MSVVLSARHEAAIIAYVALYDNCDKARCWRRIGSAIKRHGVRVTRTVYRGHARRDRSIRLVAPFFSTTPKKQMAELFVEREWPEDEGPEKEGPEKEGLEKEGPEKEGPEKEGRRIGNFFTVHLVRALVLSTRSVRFTLSREVVRELRALNGDRAIAKGDGNYTLDEYIPRLLGVLRRLVHDETHANGEEILVLNDGAFYADPELRKRGFRSLGGGDYETWYAELTGRDAAGKYKEMWPERYAVVCACYEALRRADDQFPEAACPIATRLLCEVMAHCVPVSGWFMGVRHLWCFDTRARVHIDLTRGQFSGGTTGIAIYDTEDARGGMRGYKMSSLPEFNEAMGISYMRNRMEDIVVGGTTLARIAADVRRGRQSTHRVELNVALFLSCASRVMKPRVAWQEYTDFMRRCGFEAYRDDIHGFPRVCVAPFDGAQLVRDCLGMTGHGNEEDVAELCSAHIRHVARLIASDKGRIFEVSDAFWRRNVACGGFFVLSTRRRAILRSRRTQ